MTEPRSSSSPNLTASTSKPVARPPESASSISAADRETIDRRNVQAAWLKYWESGATAIKAGTPAEQRRIMSAVAVDPTLQRVLGSYVSAKKKGVTDYGTDTIVHRPYWQTGVDGKSSAVMGDCMDDYDYGSLDSKTGKKLTAGVHRDNTKVTVVRQPDGSWKISNIEYLVKIPC